MANHKITIFGHNLTIWRGALDRFLRRAGRLGTFTQLTCATGLSTAHFTLSGLRCLKNHQKIFTETFTEVCTWTGEGSFGVTSRVSPPSMTSFLGDVIGLLDESERLESEVVKFDSAIDIRLLSTSECCSSVSSSPFLSHNDVISQKIGSKTRLHTKIALSLD